MNMAELPGSRSILFGSGAPEPFAGESRDKFRRSNPCRFEQGEMDRSLRELAGQTVPLKFESFLGRTDPKAAWRGVVLGVQSFKSNLSEHNVAYITENKELGIAFPGHVEVVTPKGLGTKRQTHMEIVGQQITNTMEHAMLVGLAKKHLERGKPLDSKWLQDTFHTTSVVGLTDIMEIDQHALKKHMTEAWAEIAFGKMLQPMKDAVNPIREKIVATRNAVTAKFEQIAERKTATKQKALSIAGIMLMGSPLVAGCVPTTMTPETPMIPSGTEVPTTPPLVPTETKVPTDIPVTKPTETATIEQPAFKAGIPETKEECNSLELQFKADGTIDVEWLAEQMKILSKIEHQWLAEQGVTAATIGAFYPEKDIVSSEYFPYSFLPVRNSSKKIVPTSCTRITYNGAEYMMYGFAGKRGTDSKQIAVIHAIYDYVGNKNNFIFTKDEAYYNAKYTPEIVFKTMHNTVEKNGIGPFQKLTFFLGNYNQFSEWFGDWQLSNALITANDAVGGVEENGTGKLARYFLIDYAITQDQEALWVSQVEQFVYPLKLIVP